MTSCFCLLQVSKLIILTIKAAIDASSYFVILLEENMQTKKKKKKEEKKKSSELISSYWMRMSIISWIIKTEI